MLIVTYYWPPAGGPGVQRWLMFVKYLQEYGVEPVVFTPENPGYPLLDEALTKQIPPNVPVIKHPIKEPYRWASALSKKTTKRISRGIISEKDKQSVMESLLLWIRGNFFIPDARKNWVKPSVMFLKKFLIQNPVEVIITTGPPHSVHLIGAALKEEINVKWVADFRDPWTQIGYHKKLKLTRNSQQKHESLEKKVLDSADALLVTSPGTCEEFSQKTQTPVYCITNGFDREVSVTVQPDEKFTITHTGSLLTGRNPQVLWEVLWELTTEISGFSDNLLIQLAGVVGSEVVESLEKYNLNKNFNNYGYLPYNKVINKLNTSQVLLLVEIDSIETRNILPGKLFEYLASQRPILALGPEGSDMAEIIVTTQSGVFFTYDQKKEIKTTILNWYQQYAVGKLELPNRDISRFHRKNLTQQLSEVLKNLV